MIWMVSCHVSVYMKYIGGVVYLIRSLSCGVYFPLLRTLFGAVGVPAAAPSPNQLFSANAAAYAF